MDTDRRAKFRTKTFVFLSIRNEMPKEVVNADEFQDFWVPPPPPETTGQKIKRKIRENPFVPLGTAYCTLYFSFYETVVYCVLYTKDQLFLMI